MSGADLPRSVRLRGRNEAVKVTRRSNSEDRCDAHDRRESTQRSPAPLTAAVRLGQWSDPASPYRQSAGAVMETAARRVPFGGGSDREPSVKEYEGPNSLNGLIMESSVMPKPGFRVDVWEL